MGNLVQVESVDALRKFRAALCKCADTLKAGLDETDAEIRRTASWLALDQQRRWKAEVRKRTEVYGRARRALLRKREEKTSLGGHYSTVEEEKALAAATRRLEEAKTKSENVRRWRRALDQEYFNYKAAAQGLGQSVEVDVPVALAQLDEMITAIEAYAAGVAPEEQSSVATSSATRADEPHASMARPTPAYGEPGAYERLRELTPPLEMLDQTPLTPLTDQSQPPFEIDAHDRHTLTGLGLDPLSVSADDRVVIAADAAGAVRQYCHRVATPGGGGDWYIAPAAPSAGGKCGAYKLDELLAARGDLEPLLTLPVGVIVVIDRSSVEAVLDARDTLLWSVGSGQRPSD